MTSEFQVDFIWQLISQELASNKRSNFNQA